MDQERGVRERVTHLRRMSYNFVLAPITANPSMNRPMLHFIKFSQVLLLVAALSLLGCSSSGGTNSTSNTTADGKDRVVLMLNWYPEAEHGGFYAAKELGIYEQFGLEVEIRPGGPSAPIAQELVAGRVQFAIGNADDVLIFREQDVPMVALMAPIQNTPRCILVHADSPVKELSQLSGMTLQAGSGRPYLSYMKSKGLLEGVQVVPYSGVPQFVTDPKNAMQAYSFSEPLLAKQQGVDARVLPVSQIGFNPYASCLVATDDYIAENQDIVSRMVVASREGWKKYFESPEKTNTVILAANQHGMSQEALDFGAQELRPLCITADTPADEIGAMTEQRWSELIGQFAELQLLDPGKVTPTAVFTTQFIDRSAPGLTD